MKRYLGPTLGAMRCLGLLLAAALSACSDVVAPVAVRATSDLPPAGVPFSITPALSTPLDAVAGSAGGRLLGTPFVLVQDRFGTVLAGVSVTFRPGANGGRVIGGEQVTSPSGVASPGGWTLGPAMERYSLIATGGKATLMMTRTPASGPPAIIIPIKGDHQVTFPGVPPSGPSLPSRIASGAPSSTPSLIGGMGATRLSARISCSAASRNSIAPGRPVMRPASTPSRRSSAWRAASLRQR